MASLKIFFFTFAIVASLLSSFSSAVRITHDGRSLMFDGQRKIILSGAIHYPRSTPEMWPDLIAKAKAGGIDTIETYVFWNAHEPQQGQYNFEGNLNLVRFIKEIQSAGLYAILRIGPYVCAEWNQGGLPGWLKQIDGMQFRTDNQPFKDAMQNFTTLIVNMIKDEKLLATQGGPIILTQIENEYGNVIGPYGAAGKRYLQWCANLALSLNVSVPWIMCQESDAPSPMMNTCNGFYCDSFSPKEKTTPKLWTENWTGWFKNWDQPDPHRPSEDVAFAVARFFQLGGVGQNYYMYHGGTNFGRTAGGPYIATSYDYDAPLNEYGHINQPKWGHLKRLHENLRKMEKALLYGQMNFTLVNPNINITMFSGTNLTSACFLSNNNNTVDFNLTFKDKSYFLPAWSVSLLPDCVQETYNTAKVTTQTTVMTKKPDDERKLTWQWTPELVEDQIRGVRPIVKTNQLLEQVYVTGDLSDYLWYITSVKNLSKGSASLSVKTNGHGIYAFVNGNLTGSQYAKTGQYNFTFETSFTTKAGTNVIALLSTTVGLRNYGEFIDLTPTGIDGGPVILTVGNTTFDLSEYEWSYMLGLDGERKHKHEVHFQNRRPFPVKRPFTWYQANFTAPLGNDPVVLDLQGMGKGAAWVNGEHLGRFWPSVMAHGSCSACDYRGEFKTSNPCSTGCNTTGQRWYHVPREYLRPGEINTLTLFEEAGGDPSAVHFEKIVTETVCGSIFEQDTVELSCFGSKISKIDYASFGNPTGSCKAFTNGTCDIPQVQAKISQACVGQEACSITADKSLMAEQGSPCDGVPVKKLVVQATCA